MRICDGRSRKRKRLIEDDWPSSDRLLWTTAFVSGDLFQRGAGAHLAPKTRFGLTYWYGRWLAHLTASDPQSLLLTPFSRITPARVRTFADELGKTNSPRSVGGGLRQLRQVMIILGSADDLAWIKAAASRLEVSSPRRSKHN